MQGNYIGTNAAGTQTLSNLGNGVEISGSVANTIGGTMPGASNLISGNADGVLIINASGNNLVQGNYIGTNAAGTQTLSNLGNGIEISNSKQNTIGGTTPGARNLITGNFSDGVLITILSKDNLVEGNYIGTDFSGTQFLGNGGNGVEISGSVANTIGGTTPGARNLISGNFGDGVSIIGTPVGPNTTNLIEGDFIGTNIQGTGPLSNGQDGVAVLDASDDTVGGTVQGAGNVISGNDGNGISFTDAPASDVVGNFIGTNAAGTQSVANAADGVLYQVRKIRALLFHGLCRLGKIDWASESHQELDRCLSRAITASKNFND